MSKQFKPGDLVYIDPDRCESNWRKAMYIKFCAMSGITRDTLFRIEFASEDYMVVKMADGSEPATGATSWHLSSVVLYEQKKAVTIPSDPRERISIGRRFLQDLFSSEERYAAYLEVLEKTP